MIRSVWENGVKACKHRLKRIVGESKLTFESWQLFYAKSSLASTPDHSTEHLQFDSNDDDGIAPLTPGHFLTGRPLEALPDQVSTTPVSTLKRWQICQALIQHFWKRWSTEYLDALQRFNKWHRPKLNLCVNDILFSKRTIALHHVSGPLGGSSESISDQTSWAEWSLSKLTKTGTFIRPIVKLCLLIPSKDTL